MTASNPSRSASDTHPVPVRRPRREEVRRRLLEAASQTFLEKGYLDSTLDDIARRAGLSKGAVYSNFASKQEIFGLLLNARVERMHEIIDAVTDPAAPKAGGRRASRLMAENLIEDADWIQLVLEFASRAGRDVSVGEIYAPFLRAQREEVAQMIDHALAGASQPDPDRAALVSTIVVTLRNGLALAHAADPDEFDVDVIEGALGAVITSLLVDGSGGRSP